MRAGLGANLTMFVGLRMSSTFRCTGAAERNTGGQLRFQELTVTDLVRARHDARGRGAHCGAVLIKPDAADQPLHILFGQTGIRTSVARVHGSRTGIDTDSDGVDMVWLFRMGTEHRAHGDCGHADFLRVVCRHGETRFGRKGSGWNPSSIINGADVIAPSEGI